VKAFQGSIKWVMLVSGLLTCATSYVLFAPEVSLRATFGVPTTSPMALIVVRHWGALIGLSHAGLGLVIDSITLLLFAAYLISSTKQGGLDHAR
jgi:hypothetical protein